MRLIRAPLYSIVLLSCLFITSCTHTKENEVKNAHETVSKESDIEKGQLDDLLSINNGLASQPNRSKPYRYSIQIQTAIRSKIENYEVYKGKECDLNIKLFRDGSVEDATINKGDPELCNMVRTVVLNSQLPPPPDEETWLKFKNIRMEFLP